MTYGTIAGYDEKKSGKVNHQSKLKKASFRDKISPVFRKGEKRWIRIRYFSQCFPYCSAA